MVGGKLSAAAVAAGVAAGVPDAALALVAASEDIEPAAGWQGGWAGRRRWKEEMGERDDG